MSDNSLINLGDLAKPINTFVVKVSNAVGILHEPRRIRKAAEAEANAAITKAQSEIEITDLQRRAEQRRNFEDIRCQKHMENIMVKAIPDVNESESRIVQILRYALSETDLGYGRLSRELNGSAKNI